jgi:competence protein ComEC
LNGKLNSPMLVLASSFALGILIAHELLPRGLTWYLLAGVVCTALAFFAWRGNLVAVAALCVPLGFCFAGAAATRLFVHRFPSNDISHLRTWQIDLNRPLRIEGVVMATPLRAPYGLECDLRLTRIWNRGQGRPITGEIRLRILNGRKSGMPAVSLGLHYADSVRVIAILRQPQNDANPGRFDYRGWLRSIQDVTWEATVEDPSLVRKVRGPAPPWMPSMIERVRQRLRASIDSLYPPWTVEGRDGAVLKAVLLGDRSSLDASTMEDFRKSGLFHLLVVAGLHVGLLTMLAEGLLRLLGFRQTWRAVMVIVFLAIYASLVQLRAPTLRASLMIAAYLVARLLDRRQPVLNAVGIAALILLLDRPSWLFDAGFQLSFTAALLIAGVALPVLECSTEPYRRGLWHLEEPALDRDCPPRVAQFRLDVRGAARWLASRWSYLEDRPLMTLKIVAYPLKVAVWAIELVVLSAIIQVGLLLPMVELFHRVAIAGIGLNVLAVPWMTILLAVAVPVVVLNAVAPALAWLPAKLLTLIMNGLFRLTEIPHLPHWLSYRVPSPPAWVAWGFALFMIVAVILARKQFRLWGACLGGAALFAFLTALAPFSSTLPRGTLQVTALDCGGGEAVFVVLPDHTTLLDGACGGHWLPAGGDPLQVRRWDPGEEIVAPYLWSRRIQSIDIFILPDSSAGYLNGVASVLGDFRVKQFWCAPLAPDSSSASLLALIERRKIRLRQLDAGKDFSLGGTSVSVLWPPSATSGDNAEGSSLALRLSNSRGCVLLAGNLDEGSQEMLLKADADVQCDVLQMPATRDRPAILAAFAERVRPAIALMDFVKRSWDRKSNWDESRPIESVGTKLYNADTVGAITVDMNDRSLLVHAYRGKGRSSN